MTVTTQDKIDAFHARLAELPEETTLKELKWYAERCATAVCDVTVPFGYWTRSDAERYDLLRQRTGKDWDAINRVWRSYTPED